MRVLVACEESQAVTTELRRLGHEAYSCDINDCSGGHPEWHIKWDALALINGNCSFLTCDGELHKVDGKWDMLIAHPPCTYPTAAIIDWTDSEVWDFLYDAKVPINPMYGCGFDRVGCIGCPMAGTAGRQKEFAVYPAYQGAYIRAFDKMIEERKRKRKQMDVNWKTGKEVFHWWMEDGVLPGQMEFTDEDLEV